MRNLFKITFLLLSYIILTGSQNQSGGCATANPNLVYPSITSFVGSFNYLKYKKIAILPFTDAPNSPQSGLIVQGLANNVFAKGGLEVVERTRLYDVINEQALSLSGVFEPSNQIKLGKILGVNAIVVGEVGQYMTVQRKTDTAYYPMRDIFTGKESYITIQGQQWNENYASISLRIIDVETGQLIFSGSGQYERGLRNPPQQIAEALLTEIIADWFMPPERMGIEWDDNRNDRFVIKKVFIGSPAAKAGIKVGDKLLKWNGIDISDKFPDTIKGGFWIDADKIEEWQKITYGYPGEKVELEVLRKDKVLKFVLTRVNKYLLKIEKEDFNIR
jgi:curli biogenesis system outer membrane secretion channel CsgG